jgi:hypothetical protein
MARMDSNFNRVLVARQIVHAVGNLSGNLSLLRWNVVEGELRPVDLVAAGGARLSCLARSFSPSS